VKKKDAPGQFLRVGDLVFCGHDATPESLGVAERVGLITELRKNHAHVFYADRGESFWLPRTSLPRIRAEDTASRALPFLLSRVMLLLNAVECEVLTLGSPAHLIKIVHDQITIDVLDQARAVLGSSLVEMLITPGGLHRIETTLALDPAELPALAEISSGDAAGAPISSDE
jgi:hypothetical protein